MKIVFIRHGAKRSSETDPALTSMGRKMSFETGRWLADNGHVPEQFLSTPTLRTTQTAEECSLAIEQKINIEASAIPEQWEEWLDFLEELCDSYPNVLALVGHHPTMHMLTEKYQLSVPRHHFATAIVLQKITCREWKCVDTWLGRADFN